MSPLPWPSCAIRGAANAIRLLLLTGARRGELLAARWADIDTEAGVWIKPAATTKQKAEHRVPLSEAACRLLGEMRQNAGDEAEWIFPAPIKAGHRTDIWEAWETLRRAADIPDVRTHDLRHSFVLCSRRRAIACRSSARCSAIRRRPRRIVMRICSTIRSGEQPRLQVQSSPASPAPRSWGRNETEATKEPTKASGGCPRKIGGTTPGAI